MNYTFNDSQLSTEEGVVIENQFWEYLRIQ